MAKEVMISGCAASAQAAKLARVEVICSYPIRPYTAVMMELAKMVANGELDAEFIHGEGEHA
ncbi:MAG: pyruvate ferredoxin oxidoreductase, partial [candidate division NC10 bacterium]